VKCTIRNGSWSVTPFNPVYLIPLVEIVPGRSTSGETVQLAESFYRRLGMSPLTLRTEVAGFLGNRLQEALWREALWIVNEGIATTAEVDLTLDRGTRPQMGADGPLHDLSSGRRRRRDPVHA
jgi:carnitine 3-dehydrogenase